MNGSEAGEVLPAAVLSGAPIELQARTVRYCALLPLFDRSDSLQHLPSDQNCYTIRRLARPPLAHGLGHSLEGS